MSWTAVGSFAVNCVTLSAWLAFSGVQVSSVGDLPVAEGNWSVCATRIESLEQDAQMTV